MKENLKPCVYKHTKRQERDVVLFVERSGEFMYSSEVKYLRYGAEGKPSVNSAIVACIRPETG